MANKQNAEMSKTKGTTSSGKPFRVPENSSEFLTQEKKDIKEERRRQRTLPMHKRGLKPREALHITTARLMKEIEDEEWKEGVANVKLKAPKKAQTKRTAKSEEFTVGTRRDFHKWEREKVRLQFFIEEGQKKIESLKKQMHSMEEQQAIAMEHFSDEAFDRHVQEEVNKTKLVLKRAEEAKKACLEMEAEIKNMSEKVMEVKMEVDKLQKELIHCDVSQDFLCELSQLGWQEQQEARNRMAENIRASAKEDKSAHMERNTGSDLVLPPIQQNPNTKFFDQNHNLKNTEAEEEGIVGNLEFYEKPLCFFTDHNQLLDIMEKLEFSIVQHFEELSFVERSIEICERERRDWQQSAETEEELLAQEIDRLSRKIKEKEVIAERYREQMKKLKDDEILNKLDNELELVQNKIKDLYSTCTGGSTNGITTSQMLEEVESYLCELLDELDKVPKKKLKPITAAFCKEKAMRLRKEEMERTAMIREEEWRRRAEVRRERAKKEIKIPVGKKEMWRSVVEKKPPKVVKSKVPVMTEEEELERYLLE